jgi:hypothetical protein
MNRPVLEFDIQSFQIDMDDDLVIDVSKWPDQSGFVTARRKVDGVPIRGFGFKGDNYLADIIYQLEEEFYGLEKDQAL